MRYIVIIEVLKHLSIIPINVQYFMHDHTINRLSIFYRFLTAILILNIYSLGFKYFISRLLY